MNEVCVVGVPDPTGGGDVPRAFITVKGNPPKTITEEIQKFANGLKYNMYLFNNLKVNANRDKINCLVCINIQINYQTTNIFAEVYSLFLSCPKERREKLQDI